MGGLKTKLSNLLLVKEFEIHSAGNEQKVSRQTINMTADSSKVKYLLTLNSVFDISKTRRAFQTSQSHLLRPRLFCWNCIKNGYYLDKKSRGLRKAARRNKQNMQTSSKQ